MLQKTAVFRCDTVSLVEYLQTFKRAVVASPSLTMNCDLCVAIVLSLLNPEDAGITVLCKIVNHSVAQPHIPDDWNLNSTLI
jgi:hypothetical protein